MLNKLPHLVSVSDPDGIDVPTVGKPWTGYFCQNFRDQFQELKILNDLIN